MGAKPLWNFYPAIISTTSRGGIARCRAFCYETSAGEQRFAVIQSDGMLLHDLPVVSATEVDGPNSARWTVIVAIDGIDEAWAVQLDSGCSSCGSSPSQATAEQIMQQA